MILTALIALLAIQSYNCFFIWQFTPDISEKRFWQQGLCWQWSRTVRSDLGLSWPWTVAQLAVRVVNTLNCQFGYGSMDISQPMSIECVVSGLSSGCIFRFISWSRFCCVIRVFDQNRLCNIQQSRCECSTRSDIDYLGFNVFSV